LRLRLLPLCCLLAAALCAPEAYAQDVPRHKPRVTDPSSSTTSSDDSSSTTTTTPKNKKKRKHATSLDDDSSSTADDDTPPPKSRAVTDDDAPPPKKRPASDDDGGSAPAKKHAADDDAATDRHGVRGDDSSELRDEADHGKPHKRARTAEEELAEPAKDEESLAKVDEPGHGLSFEVLVGPMFLHDSAAGVTTRFSFGLDFTWQFGRLIFSPEWEFLHNNFALDVSWFYSSQAAGTQEVAVGAQYHFLSLAFMFGFPVSSFFFYGKIGPALTVMPVSYSVDGVQTSFSGVKGGLIYGGGAHMNLYLGDYVGVAASLEVLRFRRQYLDDTLLTLGVGLSF